MAHSSGGRLAGRPVGGWTSHRKNAPFLYFHTTRDTTPRLTALVCTPFHCALGESQRELPMLRILVLPTLGISMLVSTRRVYKESRIFLAMRQELSTNARRTPA